MFRSVISTRLATSVRSVSTQAIQPPKTPITLGHLADNAGAVTQVCPTSITLCFFFMLTFL